MEMQEEAALTTRGLRKQLEALLARPDFAAHLNDLARYPARKVVNPLFSLLCHREENMRWRAISAFGRVVSTLAEEDRESARVIMRRFMWSLNDESGGIGWGAPEAMAEIMAESAPLAAEFSHILISYIWVDGNYLEHPELQRGVLWGLGRLAGCRPQCCRDAVPYVLPFLDAADAALRGLALWVLIRLNVPLDAQVRSKLIQDPGVFPLYLDGAVRECRIGDLAQAIAEP